MVINQLDSDEELSSPLPLIHITVRLHTQQYTSSLFIGSLNLDRGHTQLEGYQLHDCLDDREV